MTRIPHAQGVHRTLRSLRVATQKCHKGLNQAASQRMAKVDYAAADELVAKGKGIRQLQAEIDALGNRWRELCGADTAAPKRSVTPLWSYFQPILQALASLGGEARRSDLEDQVGSLIAASILPGDRTPMAQGRERWRVMIGRARKAMAAEGWIENGSGPTWKITEAGRNAAKKPMNKDLAKHS